MGQRRRGGTAFCTHQLISSSHPLVPCGSSYRVRIFLFPGGLASPGSSELNPPSPKCWTQYPGTTIPLSQDYCCTSDVNDRRSSVTRSWLGESVARLLSSNSSRANPPPKSGSGDGIVEFISRRILPDACGRRLAVVAGKFHHSGDFPKGSSQITCAHYRATHLGHDQGAVIYQDRSGLPPGNWRRLTRVS